MSAFTQTNLINISISGSKNKKSLLEQDLDDLLMRSWEWPRTVVGPVGDKPDYLARLISLGRQRMRRAHHGTDAYLRLNAVVEQLGICYGRLTQPPERWAKDLEEIERRARHASRR